MDRMPVVEVRYLLVPVYFFNLFSHYSQLNSIVCVSCSVFICYPSGGSLTVCNEMISALKINSSLKKKETQT